MPEPPPRGRSWSWFELAGLLLTGIPIAVVVLKTLLFADFNLQVIRVVARGIDFAAVALSTFGPTFLMLPAFALVGLYAVVPETRKGRVTRGALFVAVVLSCALLPLGWAAMTLLGLVGTAAQLWRPGRKDVDNRRVETAMLVVALVVSTLVSNLYAMTFWLPTEVVERTDGTRLVGYVVESGDHDLTFIHHDTRRPEILRQDSIRDRALCSLVEEDLFRRTALTPAYKLALDRGPNPPLLPLCRP
ncbi:hypothetical protein FHX81_5580 [Saccharothrix saharensis]|uniref:Uncharacterized protein n=1 Tax=Saccharothrix saharensis TaxID=571190 RepID=A0A543JJY6_9PSEU|nr:hypothetical protein [Saccharothrix saharensis]TQM83162.1 hypothetical protein FHX81_5580 [Saccharothrix saharensis]